MVRLIGTNAPLQALKQTQQIAEYGNKILNNLSSFINLNPQKSREPFQLPQRKYTKESVDSYINQTLAEQANIDRDFQLDRDKLSYQQKVLEERRNYVPPSPQALDLPKVMLPEPMSIPEPPIGSGMPTTIPQTNAQGIGVDTTAPTPTPQEVPVPPPPSEQPPAPTVLTNPQKEDKAQPNQRITIKQSNYQPPPQYLQRQHFLMLVPSGHKDDAGHPVWYLEAYERNGGDLIRVFQKPMRTGKLDGADPSVPGGHGRAPNGSYQVSAVKQAPTDNDVGEFFIPITPQFSTKRSALGIHQDMGDAGTKGCLGLVNPQDLGVVYSFIKRMGGTQLFITDK